MVIGSRLPVQGNLKDGGQYIQSKTVTIITSATIFCACIKALQEMKDETTRRLYVP